MKYFHHHGKFWMLRGQEWCPGHPCVLSREVSKTQKTLTEWVRDSWCNPSGPSKWMLGGKGIEQELTFQPSPKGNYVNGWVKRRVEHSGWGKDWFSEKCERELAPLGYCSQVIFLLPIKNHLRRCFLIGLPPWFGIIVRSALTNWALGSSTGNFLNLFILFCFIINFWLQMKS